jgi:hypothetical protein
MNVSTPTKHSSWQGLPSAVGSPKHRRRDAAIRTEDTCVLVEVELRGPSRNALFSHLGSLTERDGMSLYRHGPSREKLRVSVAVPRAHTPREAEEVVASLLERIGLARETGASLNRGR